MSAKRTLKMKENLLLMAMECWNKNAANIWNFKKNVVTLTSKFHPRRNAEINRIASLTYRFPYKNLQVNI